MNSQDVGGFVFTFKDNAKTEAMTINQCFKNNILVSCFTQ